MKPGLHVRAAALSTLMLVGAAPLAHAGLPTDLNAGAIEVRQSDLDEDRRLPAGVMKSAARVLERNQSLLGAHPAEFCARMSVRERSECILEVQRLGSVRIDGPSRVFENSPLAQGGRQWPNASQVSQFRRLRLSVPLHKGERSTSHEISLVWFRSQTADEFEECVFPLEHWDWSEIDRPERFAQAPVGICGNRELTVSQYLLEQTPDADLFALRFLSEPEALAWKSRDPERIKWESRYTAGHPYAKYFLLNSLRWWRGGSPSRSKKKYGWALRIEGIPLDRIRALEEQGELFLDIFEDGAQIELTNRSREGLLALLHEKHGLYVDTSKPSAKAPRFERMDD